jgi:hypothetical protein
MFRHQLFCDQSGLCPFSCLPGELCSSLHRPIATPSPSRSTHRKPKPPSARVCQARLFLDSNHERCFRGQVLAESRPIDIPFAGDIESRRRRLGDPHVATLDWSPQCSAFEQGSGLGRWDALIARSRKPSSVYMASADFDWVVNSAATFKGSSQESAKPICECETLRKTLVRPAMHRSIYAFPRSCSSNKERQTQPESGSESAIAFNRIPCQHSELKKAFSPVSCERY